MQNNTTRLQHYTLVLIMRKPFLLLGKKKRGFGKEKWNGFGGKVEQGESILEAARREVKEECGLHVWEMEKIAELFFTFEGNPVAMFCHVFAAENFDGYPKESEEMLPKWFSFNQIPFEEMWEDDAFWLPRVLNGEKLRGDFHFSADEKMVSWSITSVGKEIHGRGFLVSPYKCV